jgi:hypothetical protein
LGDSGGRRAGWRQPPPPGWALRPGPDPEPASDGERAPGAEAPEAATGAGGAETAAGAVDPGLEAAAAAREAELLGLRARIGRRAALLTALLTRLGPFEYRYQQCMGERYARLFELFTLIDEERKRRSSRAEEAAWAAVAAGARSSSRVLEPSRNGHNGGDGRRGLAITGPIDRPVRRLFRKLARQVHPDLATDPAERARRTELMAAANRAYALGDAEALQRLLDEWEQSPESVTGTGPEADLARLERRVVQAAKRLSAIEEELRTLARSPMLRLYRDAGAAARRGRDLLAEMGEELGRLVERTERDLDLVRAGLLA